MENVVTALSTSLDGFVADRSRDLTPPYHDLSALEEDELIDEGWIASRGAIVMGKRAYVTVAGSSPSTTVSRRGH